MLVLTVQKHLVNKVITMKKIGLGYLAISIWSASTSAAVDVYGVDPATSVKILKKYSKSIGEIESHLQQEMAKENPAERMDHPLDNIAKKRLALIAEITKKNNYKYVNFDTIFYPADNSLYTTIEIVDKNHPERIRFVNSTPYRKLEKGISHKLDLIDEMNIYTGIGMDLIINKQMSSAMGSCPVYHCGVGFNHPKLKPYLRLFNNGAIKNKKLIIETLNHDPDPERRAAAAFLVAHFNNPQEIIAVLSPHITDKDEGVRNNVMRVIGETVGNAHITNLDIMPFIDALDSPYTTDRNKALLVLSNAMQSKALRKELLEKGSDKLLALIQLKQPNNHDLAYSILKKISGKDFGATNVVAWSKWVAAEKGAVVQS